VFADGASGDDESRRAFIAASVRICRGNAWGNEHRVAYKAYYEDTDSLGVAYYANYLKSSSADAASSRGRGAARSTNGTGTGT